MIFDVRLLIRDCYFIRPGVQSCPRPLGLYVRAVVVQEEPRGQGREECCSQGGEIIQSSVLPTILMFCVLDFVRF